MEFDLVIRGGTVVDGNGTEPFDADVAVAGGRIVAIGSVASNGREEIDATGLLVTPGFIDIHTHYDGQVTWSDSLTPSPDHGVTTVVIGNCGVGFAPCRPGDRDALVNVMEGVEDIPEAVMAEGLPWNWETFPDYLDALDARRWDADVAALLPHSPLRVYAMGERALAREPATDDDVKRMRALATEAMAAGAVGFATSRSLVHRRGDGDFIPTFQADSAELVAIADAVGSSGHGVLQLIPNLDSADYASDVELLVRMAKASGRPVTYSLAQWPTEPDGWRRTLDTVAARNRAEGTKVFAQVLPRPMGAMCGLTTSANPFSYCPTFQAIENHSLDDKLAAMRDPAFRERLIHEEPGGTPTPLHRLLRRWDGIYTISDRPDYEPAAATSVAALAAERGIGGAEMAFELMLEQEGRALLMMPFANYADGNLDATLAMLTHPESIVGLGDGGAHYGVICDASYTTTLLAHWTRDRIGDKLSIPAAIRKLTADNADFLGFGDRGRIAPGQKADINIFDHAELGLLRPRIVHDLPGGGRRVMQDACGYHATIVAGSIVRRNGKDTGARPGRLVRAH